MMLNPLKPALTLDCLCGGIGRRAGFKIQTLSNKIKALVLLFTICSRSIFCGLQTRVRQI